MGSPRQRARTTIVLAITAIAAYGLVLEEMIQHVRSISVPGAGDTEGRVVALLSVPIAAAIVPLLIGVLTFALRGRDRQMALKNAARAFLWLDAAALLITIVLASNVG